jgi:hypothetical protein
MGQGSGRAWCEGIVTETNRATGRTTQRPCPLALDPVLAAAGFTTHPNCDPAERSALWPVMTWPRRMLRLVTD